MKLSRILLVDHDGGDLERITESIINLNMGPTVVARNEVEAIEDVNNRDPELVIMNICESGAARSVNLANKIKSKICKTWIFAMMFKVGCKAKIPQHIFRKLQRCW